MKKKVAIALGGGGMRGYAHIGVLRQLEKSDFEIAAIAGTSIGGILGALYACGLSPNEIESLIDDLNMRTLFRIPKGEEPALLGLGGLLDLLKSKIGKRDYSTLSLPFACTAVDLKSGCEIILDTGIITDALQATSAMPGIFPAKVINSLYLVDGGIFDPVPVAVARSLQPGLPVIAVCLTPEIENWDNLPHMDIPKNTPIPPAIMETVLQLRLGQALRIFIDSLDVMTNMVAELRLKIEKPDYIIRPEIKQYTMFSNADPHELIMRGEDAVKTNLDNLEKIFSTRQKISRWFASTKSPGKRLSHLQSNEDSSAMKKREQANRHSN
jgi:NTE family protein